MSTTPSEDSSLRWAINGDDLLVSTSPEWDRFAIANGAPEVVASRVLGRPIWSFLSDPTTHSVYQRIFAIVRAGRRLLLPFRCDSPTRRRSMMLSIEPRPLDGIAFTSTLVASEERIESLPLLARSVPGEAPHLVSCSWCGRLLVTDAWMELERAIPLLELFHSVPPLRLTHGICADCAQDLESEMARAAAE